MDEIHLDPACDFVSVKSAESDGVSFDVAFKHYAECQRCRGYHTLMVHKTDLFGTTIKHTVASLEADEKASELRKLDNINSNTLRLDFLLTHLGGSVEPVSVEFPYKHTDIRSSSTGSTAADVLPSCVRSSVQVSTEAGEYEVYVTSGVSGFNLRRGSAKGAALYGSAVQTIAALAKAIGKHRYSKGKKQ